MLGHPSNKIDNIAQERNVIFISHATPQDNEFAIWLAARLQADGYEVWVDKTALLGGEKFWQEIDQVIRHKSIKFLIVYSENICVQQQRGILKDGIEKEKSMAESIAKSNKLIDFIILLNIDGSESNLFIGADTLNQIPFYENWASGYAQMLKKFNKEGLAPTSNIVGIFSKWYEDEYIIKNGIKELTEIYYDSLWPIPDLPQTFYIYVFENEDIATQIQRQAKYPASRISNIVTTFYDAPSFEITVEGKNSKIDFVTKFEVKTSEVLQKMAREGFPNTRDVENHLKSLLQRVFHLIMKARGLRWYDMANKRWAYFFTKEISPKITFQYVRRAQKSYKRKSISGKHLNNFWHYAISAKPVLTPQLAFSLKSHIIFTTDGCNPWDEKDKMHAARRKKGRLLFNEEWRDMLFAFLHALCRNRKSLGINLSPSFRLSLLPWTNTYQSDFGYIEPKEKDRHSILEAEYEYYDRDDDIDIDEVTDV